MQYSYLWINLNEICTVFTTCWVTSTFSWIVFSDDVNIRMTVIIIWLGWRENVVVRLSRTTTLTWLWNFTCFKTAWETRCPMEWAFHLCILHLEGSVDITQTKVPVALPWHSVTDQKSSPQSSRIVEPIIRLRITVNENRKYARSFDVSALFFLYCWKNIAGEIFE